MRRRQNWEITGQIYLKQTSKDGNFFQKLPYRTSGKIEGDGTSEMSSGLQCLYRVCGIGLDQQVQFAINARFNSHFPITQLLYFWNVGKWRNTNEDVGRVEPGSSGIPRWKVVSQKVLKHPIWAYFINNFPPGLLTSCPWSSWLWQRLSTDSFTRCWPPIHDGQINIARIANAVQVTICLLVSTSVY